MSDKVIDIRTNASNKNIIPPTSIQIEMIWKSIPILSRLYQAAQLSLQSGNELMETLICQEMLLREFAEKSKIELSTPKEIRHQMYAKRVEFLNLLLEKEDVPEKEKADIQKEISGLEKVLDAD